MTQPIQPPLRLALASMLVASTACTSSGGTTTTTTTDTGTHSSTGEAGDASSTAPSSSSTSDATVDDTSSPSTGEEPRACSVEGNDTRWYLDAPQGLDVGPSAAQLVLTDRPGERAALLLVPALAMGQPVLLVAGFDPHAPPAEPVALTASELPITPSIDLPWTSTRQRASAAAPGKVAVILGPSEGTSGGRAHRLTIDVMSLAVDLDEELGGAAAPVALATAGATHESAWHPSGASEANHYFLTLVSEQHATLAEAPSLDCDAHPRPMLAAFVPASGGFIAAMDRCDGAPESTLAFGPFRGGAFVGDPVAVTLGFDPASLMLLPDAGVLWLVASDADGGELWALPLDEAGDPLGEPVDLGPGGYVSWAAQLAGSPVVGVASHEALTVRRPDGELLLETPQELGSPMAFRSFVTGVGLDDALLVVAEEPSHRVAIDLYPCAP